MDASEESIRTISDSQSKTCVQNQDTHKYQEKSPSAKPVVHVVLSAIFPTGIRGKAVSVISAFNWATNLLISMTFLTLTERIGLPSVIFSYAAMSFVLVVFVIVFVPETKGRSLEQISKELAMKNHLSSRLLFDRRKHEAAAQPSQEEKALATV
ncbi:solute carrier family 2, facilitated glucose transporter member 12 isoform X3 [Sinocyclocheilus anshuiensis]|uniref:solute carrier family 2, facilitated glucose transporter member 12 isoform X3 n=1 Tax=Sinocyclocheilus anshuiensis TaxID=1608454 RepID=UPI0007B7A20D|nr:PREDICTED: solute carrier family 2, facilitated glucose transporter member 12 isoform X3 [Sinocyclocheilus anshuiensis]